MIWLGKKIRNLRIKRGLTQWQLSQEVGTTPGTILLIERGIKPCPEELIERMADALQCEERELKGE